MNVVSEISEALPPIKYVPVKRKKTRKRKRIPGEPPRKKNRGRGDKITDILVVGDGDGKGGDIQQFRKTDKQREATRLLSNKGKTFCMLDGGSRSGKTFILIYATFVRALRFPGSRHCILRLRYNHARTSLCMDTIPKVLKLCFPDIVNQIDENKSDSYYILPNGSQVWIGGLDDKKRVEKILGNEYGTIYFNECSQLAYESMEMALTRLAQKVDGMQLKAYYDCNPPSIKHWTYLQWYQNLNPETMLPLGAPDAYGVVKMNPVDNVANIGETYIDGILGNLSGLKRKRFLEGAYATGSEGALFRQTDINKNRILYEDVPDYSVCAVGVDPAAKGKFTSDETGIIGGGSAIIDDVVHYYVEMDSTLRGMPKKWAEASVQMYDDLNADKIIGETNNGGDMVESTLRTIDPEISYLGVHASRGKAIRAEPVASLSAQGRLHFVESLPDLENECCSWEPDESEWSPNRMDAMVWMVTYLMSKNKRKRPGMRGLNG
jgi:hypothetical protein